MPVDRDAGGHERSWLVEPVGVQDVQIHVDVGEGVELSDEVRAALDTLVGGIFGSEVEGFKVSFPGCSNLCPSMAACGDYWCSPLGICSRLTSKPCFVDARCAICTAN